MLDKGTYFPQYRKLSNDKVFYRIIDERNFDEVQVIGTKAHLIRVEAKQYPDILRVRDMLEFSIPGYVNSDKEEFDGLSQRFTFI